MNWFAITVVSIVGAIVIGLLFWKNNKDRKDLEKKIKDDYHKPSANYNDIDIDEVKK